MSWNHFSNPGSSQPDLFSSLLGTGAGAGTSGADALSTFPSHQPPTNPTGPSESAGYEAFLTMQHFNLMTNLPLELDAGASASYPPRMVYPTVPAHGHTFDAHFGAPYESRGIPPSISRRLGMHPDESAFFHEASDSSAFTSQPPLWRAHSVTRPSATTSYSVPYVVPTDPFLASIRPPMNIRHLASAASTHRASIGSGSRATPYPALSPVLSTVPDYTLEEGFQFHVTAGGLSTDLTELKEWKPEQAWDYTIRIEGIKTQMGADININLNNPRNIPCGSLGLWVYMKMEGSDDFIEGPTCGFCEKRKFTNVSRFRDAITSEQGHTRIICSPSTTWLRPLPDNTAYFADVTFLIWCPAYHEPRSDHQGHVRVKQTRRHFQLVFELRDHSDRALATTTLHRTWGGNKPSRRSKKDADSRSEHHPSTSGEFTASRVDNHILSSSHPHLPSPRSAQQTPLNPHSRLPTIEVEASSPTRTTSPPVDLPSSPYVVPESIHCVEAPAPGTGTSPGLPAAPPPIHSPDRATVLEEVKNPHHTQDEDIVEVPAILAKSPVTIHEVFTPDEDIVEVPAPLAKSPVIIHEVFTPDEDIVEVLAVPSKPPITTYKVSTPSNRRRSPAPSPESPGRSVSRSVLGPTLIMPPLSDSVVETVPPRTDFLGVWREEGRVGDEVHLIGAGFNRETEYFVKFGAVRPIHAFYQASNTLTCIVPWSNTVGIVAVSIVSGDGSIVLCEQQQRFRYLSDKKLAALQRIMVALDSADEDDLQEEAADFARRLSSKKQERRSREEGHEVNTGRQHQLSEVTAMVTSPVPIDHDPLLRSQPLRDDDNQTLPPSRSSTLVAPIAHVYSFHKIKSLDKDPSSWDRVTSWFERSDPTMAKGRKRPAEEMADEERPEMSCVPESPTLVESLAAKQASSPRVRAQQALKTSCETQPPFKRQRLVVA